MTGSATPEPAARGPVAVLVGFMGAGKSTVGTALARLLDVPLLDTDAEIVARDGRPIPQIFADDGERAFRDLEARVIDDVLATHRGVVALGGGAVTTPAVRESLLGHTVVHLDVTPDVGWRRVRGSDRPLLRADPGQADPEQRYRDLHAARVEMYRSVTVHRVDTTADGSAEAVARRIVEALTGPDSRPGASPVIDPAPTIDAPSADESTPTAGSPS